MRVITGIARGKRLETLEGNDVRPTTDMVKEAVFSIIQFQIEGRKFLDLFAGCGQIGIEAISRGAEVAYFVDQSRNSQLVIEKNIRETNFADKSKIVRSDALSFIKNFDGKFDIAYLDPPYRLNLIEECLPYVADKMNKTGIIVCETSIDRQLPDCAGDFVLNREYRYGKIKVATYICKQD